MNLQHFLYGQFNGVGYRLIASSKLNEILSDESRQYLCRLDGPGTVQTWLPNDQLVAISYLSYTLDEYERRNVWNHTILLFIEDYFELNPPVSFEKYFIKETGDLPRSLEPLRINPK